MPEVDVPKYIELYDKRNKLKQRISDHIGKQFYILLREYETEIGNIFSSSDPVRITGSDFKDAVENFIADINNEGNLRQDNARNNLIEINNEIKDVLNFKYPVDYKLLPRINQDSHQTLQEIQRIVSDYRAGKMTELRARRTVQRRLRVPVNVSRTFINTQLAGFDNTSAQTIAGLAGLNKAAYFGPATRANSHFLCIRLMAVQELYTEAQIRAMDNGCGIPVLRYCGGYNCMHEWLWVSEDWKEVNGILRRAR